MDTCGSGSCGLPYEWLSEIPQTIKEFHDKYVKGVHIDSGDTGNTTAAFWMIGFMCTFVVLCFIGTFITAFELFFTQQVKRKLSTDNGKEKKKRYQENGLLASSKPFFSCFCMLTNARDLLDISPSKGEIPCLHGIRVLSELCIVMFHILGAVIFTSARKPVEHAIHLGTWFSHIGMLIIFHAVDALFLLSGLLNAHSYFRNESTKKRKPWIYFYVHRFLRLTPVYMIVLAFYGTIFQNVASTSSWSSYFDRQTCMKYWWHNFLYINDVDSVRDMCMTWSWFLSDDMKFFLISPLFLVTLWRWPKIGYSVLGLFLGGSTLRNFITTYYYNLPSAWIHIHAHFEQKFIFEEFMERAFIYLQKLYFVSYARTSAYLIGIGTAYCIYQWQERKQLKLSSVTLKRGWTVTAGLMVYIIFGVSRRLPTLGETALYNAINQICFAVVIAWIICVCITGHADSLNNFLSSKKLIPLSRLSYCAYLSHTILVLVFVIYLEKPLECSIITLATVTCCLALSSFVIALFLYLVFECPFAKMEKMIWTKFGFE